MHFDELSLTKILSYDQFHLSLIKGHTLEITLSKIVFFLKNDKIANRQYNHAILRTQRYFMSSSLEVERKVGYPT